jgi:hypothetical protein
MRTLVSKIVFHMKGARRASICSWMSGVNDVVSSLNQGGSDLSKGGGIGDGGGASGGGGGGGGHGR